MKAMKRNSGILGKNDQRTAEIHPNMKGRCNIGGTLYWISAWTKTGRDGSKFQGLAFELAKPQFQTAQYLEGGAAGASEGGAQGGFDDDIPF
jgi:hypothetical protein